MSTNRPIARFGALIATAALTALLAAGTASAHVTANIYGKPAEQGGYTAVVFRVPNEEPAAGTVKIEVSIDPQYAFASVRTRPVAGWKATISKTKLEKPVQNPHGAEIDEVVTKVTWTAQGRHQIAPGTTEFEEFALSAGPLPTTVEQLVLPTAQFYRGGKVVRWDAPPPVEGAEEPEYPAPVVPLVPSSEGHGAATGPAAHTDPEEAAAETGVDTTARWMGGVGLLLGALGLGLGAGATVRARQTSATGKDQG